MKDVIFRGIKGKFDSEINHKEINSRIIYKWFELYLLDEPLHIRRSKAEFKRRNNAK